MKKHLLNCPQMTPTICGCDLLGKSNPIDKVKEAKYEPKHECVSGCNKDFDCPLNEEEIPDAGSNLPRDKALIKVVNRVAEIFQSEEGMVMALQDVGNEVRVVVFGPKLSTQALEKGTEVLNRALAGARKSDTQLAHDMGANPFNHE